MRSLVHVNGWRLFVSLLPSPTDDLGLLDSPDLSGGGGRL